MINKKKLSFILFILLSTTHTIAKPQKKQKRSFCRRHANVLLRPTARNNNRTAGRRWSRKNLRWDRIRKTGDRILGLCMFRRKDRYFWQTDQANFEWQIRES